MTPYEQRSLLLLYMNERMNVHKIYNNNNINKKVNQKKNKTHIYIFTQSFSTNKIQIFSLN